MRDILTFTFQKGYFDNGTVVEVPEGSIIPDSKNVLYNKNGRLMSFGGLLTNSKLKKGSVTKGGSRAFMLDRDVLGFLGKISEGEVVPINGNIIQNVGKSIWFVGSNVADAVSAVKLESDTYTELALGGVAQVMFIAAEFNEGVTAASAGNLTVTFNEVALNEGDSIDLTSKTVTVTLAGGEDRLQVMDKIRLALKANNAFFTKYYYATNSFVVAEDYYWVRCEARDIGYRYTVSLSGGTTGVKNQAAEVPNNGTVPTLDYAADLKNIPHFCKWTGKGWSSPMRVGLPEVEPSESPGGQVKLDFAVGGNTAVGFTGLVQGSRSVRIARKRLGAVSIASTPSNVVTIPESGGRLLINIPSYPPDSSMVKDNEWFIYVTYKGLGSTSTHKLFPLPIPESALLGLEGDLVTQYSGNAKYRVYNAGTLESQRQVEIEFTDGDLLAIDPLDDAFPAEECLFIAKLGNVLCLIGTGDDQTGFDVSIPNNFEGFNPEWRDWLGEVPVSVATEQDLGFFWVLTSNNVYMAEWTGVTQGAAPVILRKVSSIHGAIGEGASVCVNGTLFLLTKGKTPVAIAPKGQANNKIGIQVQNYFHKNHSNNTPYFDEKTKISWDEATNSVVFAGNLTAIAMQLDTGLWSAPITFDSAVTALVPVNGNLNVCQKNETEEPSEASNFMTGLWNFGQVTSLMEWKISSNFEFGKSGRALKDIIQVEGTFTSPATGVKINFGTYKNFNTSTLIPLSEYTVSSANPLITVRKYTESLDYDCLSAVLYGTRGGQTIHNVNYTVDVHTIDRQS
jgi:hypothetical protein